MPQLVPGVPVSRKEAGGVASLGVFTKGLVVPARTGRVVNGGWDVCAIATWVFGDSYVCH